MKTYDSEVPAGPFRSLSPASGCASTSAALASIFNSPRTIAYVKRRKTIGTWSQPDRCAPPTGTCSDGSPCSGWKGKPCGANGTCTLSLDGLGKSFGPSGTPGECIRDTDPSDGIGRFPDLHGTNKDKGDYGNGFVNAMWDAFGPW